MVRLRLNVSGTVFVTSRETVCVRPDSFFARLLAHDSSEEVFVDRDPTHFRWILNYMRGSCVLPNDRLTLRELRVEADFYLLTELTTAIDEALCHATQSPSFYLRDLLSVMKRRSE